MGDVDPFKGPSPASMKWHMQTGNITTNTKVKIYLILPKFSAAKIVNQECHIDDSVKGIYDMILLKYILP